MQLWELFLIAVGLSMDAFAASVCKGLGMTRLNMHQGAVIALFFGGFQALMPLLGWFLGRQFEAYIVSFDHWIAFVLLGIIGGKMIYDSFKEDDCEVCGARFDLVELLALALATSIDALAVGVTFAFLKTDIIASISVIGIVTFALSLIGVVIGYNFGARYKNKAQLAGGSVLVLIGVKILAEHLAS